MATESTQSTDASTGIHSPGARAVLAAAATGAAAAYGVQRLRTGRQNPRAGQESGGSAERDDESGGGKREALTHALSTKVAQAKDAASRYAPVGRRHSTFDTVWEAASGQLLPIAKEAAASLGRTVGKKAPELVRDELMPRFIDGFEEATD